MNTPSSIKQFDAGIWVYCVEQKLLNLSQLPLSFMKYICRNISYICIAYDELNICMHSPCRQYSLYHDKCLTKKGQTTGRINASTFSWLQVFVKQKSNRDNST